MSIMSEMTVFWCFTIRNKLYKPEKMFDNVHSGAKMFVINDLKL